MAKNLTQLQSGDNKIIAYDEETKQFFIAKLEPLSLQSLTKEEIVEVVQKLVKE